LEQEVVITAPVVDAGVAVCPPMEVDATITTYPAGGLEQEVVIAPPAAEAEIAVCPPAEPEVAMEEDDEADAFDFFSPEPIGSRARDLEREQEMAAAAAAAAAAATTVTIAAAAASATTSEEITTVTSSTESSSAAESSTWVTETESVIITTTTTTTTITEGGTVVEKKEVSVSSQSGDAMDIVETTREVVDAGVSVAVDAGVSAAAGAVSVSTDAAAVTVPAELVQPLAMFYTEEMSSAAGATGEIVQEGFRVVGPQGQAVPEDVLEEAGHPEKQ